MNDVRIHHVRHGALCHFASDQVIGAALAHYGEWAEEELYLLRRVLQPNGVVLDIGANVGTHSLAFSRFVGSSGRVLAFDGQRRAYQLLATNMMLNRCANVTAYNVLVGRQTALSMVDEPQLTRSENLGSMSFGDLASRTDLLSSGFLVPIAAIAIDGLRLHQCDLIKIDVEGMELDVLHGALRTLQRHKPTVYFEQTSEAGLLEIKQLLGRLGYDLYWHVTRPFNERNYRLNQHNIFGTSRETNILAVHRSRTNLAQALDLEILPKVEDNYPSSDAAPGGWSLPSDAYSDLDPPVAHDPSVKSFDAILPGAAAWGTPDFEATDRLRADFCNLLADRVKAQEVMEFLSQQVAQLSAERDADLHQSPPYGILQ